jgi:magnesium and cobalt exporter, CNNM family
MIPLLVFLLACAAVYLGAIEAAFSALMRLSLRLLAERSGRPGHLAAYLDDPVLLFAPLRLLLGLVTAAATALLAMVIGASSFREVALVMISVAAFIVIVELLLPLAIVARDPERVLEILLPTFNPIARTLGPFSRWTAQVMSVKRPPTATPDEAAEEASEATKAYLNTAEQEGLIEGEERRLLQSIVDFGGTLVREVMTPRPDIVAIPEAATVGELRALFREQEYSRFPVFRESLDNIAGFAFVKDLVALNSTDDTRPITSLLRPAVIVPESKRVPELLKQFQRQQTQIAIVVDEYGGTAGLVTVEDIVEELVGEIKDEYDVESEPIAVEPDGAVVVAGRVAVDRLEETLHADLMQAEQVETVGGFVTNVFGHIPRTGEKTEHAGFAIEVLDAERKRVNRVRFRRHAEAAAE